MGYKCHFCDYDCAPRLKAISGICTVCRNFDKFKVSPRMSEREIARYERYLRDEEEARNHSADFDRDTALMVLKDLSSRMRPSRDQFGDGILIIDRAVFEMIRKKYLDKTN